MYRFDGSIESQYDFDVMIYGYTCDITDAMRALTGAVDINLEGTGYESLDELMEFLPRIRKDLQLFSKIEDNEYSIDENKMTITFNGYFEDVDEICQELHDWDFIK